MNTDIILSSCKSLGNLEDLEGLDGIPTFRLEQKWKPASPTDSENTFSDDLSQSIYETTLDLGMETLGILLNEGLNPTSYLLDIGCNRFMTTCYLLSYLDQGRYNVITDNIMSINICHKYLDNQDISRPFNATISKNKFNIEETCKGKYDFILIQNNIVTMERDSVKKLFAKISKFLEKNGKAFIHYVEKLENVDRKGKIFLKSFKEILEIASEKRLSIKIIPYRKPWNLKFICLTINQETSSRRVSFF